jgi:hypothetical protein
MGLNELGAEWAWKAQEDVGGGGDMGEGKGWREYEGNL